MSLGDKKVARFHSKALAEVLAKGMFPQSLCPRKGSADGFGLRRAFFAGPFVCRASLVLTGFSEAFPALRSRGELSRPPSPPSASVPGGCGAWSSSVASGTAAVREHPTEKPGRPHRGASGEARRVTSDPAVSCEHDPLAGGSPKGTLGERLERSGSGAPRPNAWGVVALYGSTDPLSLR